MVQEKAAPDLRENKMGVVMGLTLSISMIYRASVSKEDAMTRQCIIGKSDL